MAGRNTKQKGREKSEEREAKCSGEAGASGKTRHYRKTRKYLEKTGAAVGLQPSGHDTDCHDCAVPHPLYGVYFLYQYESLSLDGLFPDRCTKLYKGPFEGGFRFPDCPWDDDSVDSCQYGAGYGDRLRVLAVALNTKGLKARRIYKTLLIFPWAMPAYVSILVWRVGMYNTEFGLLNKLLVAFGFDKVDFLSRNVPAFISCMVLNLWMSLPYMILMMDGALQSIDQSMYESAVLDGANLWQKNRYITIPSLRKIMAPAVIMTTFITFKQFDIIYLLTMQKGSVTGSTLQTIITYAHQNAFVSNNYGLSAAVSMIIFIIIILFSFWTTGYRRRKRYETVCQKNARPCGVKLIFHQYLPDRPCAYPLCIPAFRQQREWGADHRAFHSA